MRRGATATLLVIVAVLVTACGGEDEQPAGEAAAPATPGLPAGVLDQLREGESVLVFRHATTESASFQQEVLGDCARQRALSDEGRAQSRRIGRAMRAAGIPIGDVRASPMCRTRETARLMAGRVTVDRDLLTPGMVGKDADDRRRVRTLRRLADTPPSGRGNTVLVTHTGNIGEAFDNESLLEGGALLFRPDGDGRPSAPTRIQPDAWEAHLDG